MTSSCRARFLLFFAAIAVLAVAASLLLFSGRVLTMLAAPRVVQVSPSAGAADILPSSPITVTFSTAMDRAATERAISVSPSSSLAPHWLDERTLVLVPGTRWPLSTTVAVSLSTEARSDFLRPLEADFNSSFVTLGPPRVAESSPAVLARFAYARKPLAITFNREMDRASVESRLHISPPVDGEHLSWQDRTLLIYGAFRPGTAYRVMLAAGAADKQFELKADREMTWTFTATSQYPLLAPSRPGEFTSVLAGQKGAYRVQATNISQIDARLYGLDSKTFWTLKSGSNEAVRALDPPGAPLRTWTADPRAALDRYGQFSLPLDPLNPGLYYLVLESPEAPTIRQFIVATRTDLTIKRSTGSLLVWATGRADGNPAAGLLLALYDEQGNKLADGTTDAQGIFETEVAAGGGPIYAIAMQPGSFAMAADDWQDGIEPWHWPVLAVAETATPDAAQSSDGLTVKFDRAAYASGDTIRVTIAAPGQKGRPVHWRLDARDEAASGEGDTADSSPAPGAPALREAAMGQGVLDADGKLVVEIPAALSGEQDSQLYAFEALVTPETGDPISGLASAVVHRGQFSIAASPDSPVGSKGQRTVFQIRTFDLRGDAAARMLLDYTLRRLQWDCEQQEDEPGRRAYRCFERAEGSASGRFTTDARGEYRLEFTPSHGGIYELELAGRDGRGRRVSTRVKVAVSAPDEQVSWPLEERSRIPLQADNASYSPGQNARLLIESPYPRATALVTVEGDRILWREVLQLESNSAVLSIPIRPEYAPNVDVGVVLVSTAALAAAPVDLSVGHARLLVASRPDGAAPPVGPSSLLPRTASSATTAAGWPNQR